MSGLQRGRLIAFRADRLGARLVSLMNAMRIASEVDADFACAWTETTGVGDVFNDPTELFDDTFVARHFLTPSDWKSARPEAATLRPGAAGDRSEIAAILERGQDLIVGNAFGVITMSGEDLAAVTPRFRAQLSEIPFSKRVGEAMRAADAALVGHTAYHIRRGDLTDDLKAMNKAWPHKMVPNEFYEIHMEERLGSSGGVVLFSDDADTIAHYRGRFPSLKILGDVIDSAGLTEAQRDLVELYAMARCESIIAPQRSAFSSTAADLFGAVKLPIGDALGDDLMDRAHQALILRIEQNPDSFSGDGDIGQSLVHVGVWLEKQGRWSDAARIFSHQVQSGLNISFVYPQTMTYQHQIGDNEGVLATADAMQRRHVVHSKDLVNARILHGYAQIRTGDRAFGLKQIVNGFWHDPGSGLARNVVPLMVELGWLDHANFLPCTPLQRSIGHRRGPMKTIAKDLPGIDAIEGLILPESVGRLETVIWDWAPLLQSVSINAAVRTGAIERVINVLERAKAGPELAVELASQLAILRAFMGDVDTAKSELKWLGERSPESWQVWQRLSHVYWIHRDTQPALAAAERAVALLPDAPVLRGWLGMIQLRAKQVERALENLRLADAANTGFGSIALLYGQALSDFGDRPKALEAVRKARSLAPTEVRAAILEAQLLRRSGRPHEAAAELRKLVDWQCATAKVFMMLVSVLQELDETDLAAEVAGIGSQRFPRHERIVALGRELAA